MKSQRWFWILPLMTVLRLPMAAQAPASIPPDREQLLAGAAVVKEDYAERAGYPSPEKLLAKKDELGLTREKLKKIEALTVNLPVALKVKGEEIVEEEEGLAKLFEAGTVTEKIVRERLEKIGKLRAELRFAHLQVYLKMKQILTPNEWARYKELTTGERK